MKIVQSVFAVVLVISIGLTAHAQFALPPLKNITVTPAEAARMAKTTAVIETKFGNMTLRFFPDVAPGHVKNFLELARQGFYDGTTFHRVMRGFMIQGGDPLSKDKTKPASGAGGPGYRIKAEYNTKPHKRGILSMASTNMPDSAGSQFFICFDMDPGQQVMLDGHYTVFGVVESGMEVADKIVALQVPGTQRPSERIEMRIRVVEGK